jgi:pSer/pThr/pTyr-binding forkhead associated (FHA) protein
MWLLRSDELTGGELCFRLPPGATRTVGRASPADLIVDAPLVSRLHCRIETGEDRLSVTDLESTNGTYVNGERVQSKELRAGDRLRVGRVDFQVSRFAAGESGASGL